MKKKTQNFKLVKLNILSRVPTFEKNSIKLFYLKGGRLLCA